MTNSLSRRGFLARLGAGAACAGLPHQQRGASGRSFLDQAELAGSAAWTPPPTFTNPNILFIMVDQMRSPMWLSSSQMRALNQDYLPNIFGKLRNKAYNFQQYYVAATICTASRATLLTGLYAPQTAAYLNQEAQGAAPVLNPAFPIWPRAIAALNPAYLNNCWWFGKWHLSVCNNSDPLAPYFLRTRTYPGGEAKNPSPDGYPNEGANGGAFGDYVFASDAQIAGDFVAWLQGQAPSQGSPSSPWCAAVSFINPHDFTDAPAWLQANPFPPQDVPRMPVYFWPPGFGPDAGGPPALFTTTYPSQWNYENLQKVANKPPLQLAFRNMINWLDGKVTDWLRLMNQYYWEQNIVDRQIGAVLSALQSSGQDANTIIIFTSDHGDYAGSHGLHAKGYAAYDESIHVPFYIHFPGQNASITMDQMCSSVDVFGLICDLATNGRGDWRRAYPDLAPRQSLWDFLYSDVPETRVAPNLRIPYILHTCDLGNLNGKNGHIVCLRTKADNGNTAPPGGKLAIYSSWDPCSTIPNSTLSDYEFYDYANNRREMGNDYSVSNNKAVQYVNELGAWGPPATGLIAAELNAPLTGAGTDGRPVKEAQATARRNYFDRVAGKGSCTA